MAEAERVDLAHEPDFVLGRLTVSPSRRELVRDDGVREVLEHRVMQVLIALHRVGGGIVTRDELTRSCWEGRIVGEDAINRVISRLRKAADRTGAGSFRIETVTKIGYRLAGEGIAAPPAAGPRPSPAARPTRRTVALGGAALGIAALVGGGTWLYRRAARPAVPPEVERLMARGWTMMHQGDHTSQTEAAGLFRRAVELAPEHADGWGSLAFIYSYTSRFYPPGQREAMLERGRAAAARALAIDPRNGLGRAAMAFAQPIRGHWLEMEEALRDAARDHPDNDLFVLALGFILRQVGRHAEAADTIRRLTARTLEPVEYIFFIDSLWGSGQLEEMDRRIAEAVALYPMHGGLFFQRYQIWLFNGRASAAAALIADRTGRPGGLTDAEWDYYARVAHLFEGRVPADIAGFVPEGLAQARGGSAAAQLVLEYFAGLGLIGEAFAVADACFFGRGFEVPDRSFPGARSYVRQDDRETFMLFDPSTRAMRADPRFGRLTEALGLERYWREAGVEPDYRRR